MKIPEKRYRVRYSIHVTDLDDEKNNAPFFTVAHTLVDSCTLGEAGVSIRHVLERASSAAVQNDYVCHPEEDPDGSDEAHVDVA